MLPEHLLKKPRTKNSAGTYSDTTPFFLGFNSPMDYRPAGFALAACLALPESSLDLGLKVSQAGTVAALVSVLYGLRSVEVRRLTVANYRPPNTLFVGGAKGSGARTVVLPLGVLNAARLSQTPRAVPLFPCSYDQMYRAALAMGLAVKPKGYSKRIVTHIGRHRLAEQAVEVGMGDEVSSILSHKSKRASQWYTKEVDLLRDKMRKRAERERKNAKAAKQF